MIKYGTPTYLLVFTSEPPNYMSGLSSKETHKAPESPTHRSYHTTAHAAEVWLCHRCLRFLNCLIINVLSYTVCMFYLNSLYVLSYPIFDNGFIDVLNCYMFHFNLRVLLCKLFWCTLQPALWDSDSKIYVGSIHITTLHFLW